MWKINEIKYRKAKKNIHKTKSSFSENINKMDKPLPKWPN